MKVPSVQRNNLILQNQHHNINSHIQPFLRTFIVLYIFRQQLTHYIIIHILTEYPMCQCKAFPLNCVLLVQPLPILMGHYTSTTDVQYYLTTSHYKCLIPLIQLLYYCIKQKHIGQLKKWLQVFIKSFSSQIIVITLNFHLYSKFNINHTV